MTEPIVTPGYEYTEREREVIDWYVKELNGRPIIAAVNANLGYGDPIPQDVKFISSPWGETVDIREPLMVLREVTFREWQDSLPEGSPGKRYSEADGILRGVRYYEISTD